MKNLFDIDYFSMFFDDFYLRKNLSLFNDDLISVATDINGIAPNMIPNPLISEIVLPTGGGGGTTGSVEIVGTAGDSFSGQFIIIDGDSNRLGDVANVQNVSGTFDANGLLTFAVANMEDPTATYILVSGTTTISSGDDVDANNDEAIDNISLFGTVLDVISLTDSGNNAGDFADDFGGVSIPYLGSGNGEPDVVMRSGGTGDWFAIYNGDIYDESGVIVSDTDFSSTPSTGGSLGSVNPVYLAGDIRLYSDSTKVLLLQSDDSFSFIIGLASDGELIEVVDDTTVGDVGAVTINTNNLTLEAGANFDGVFTLGTAVNLTLTGLNTAEVIGNSSANTIIGSEGANSLSGGAGNDLLRGSDANDILSGGDGDDELRGGLGDDELNGGLNNDRLIGGSGNDTLNGNEGDDVISSFTGNDTVNAGSGNDIALGNEGDDILHGGDGDDILIGNVGMDTLNGDANNDKIFGKEDADILDGGAGNDLVDGGSGTDFLTGGAGNDRLRGGSEADTFIFEDGFGSDVILDFEDGVDILDLSGLSGVSSISDLTIDDLGSGLHTRVTTMSGDTFLLLNIDAANIDGADFVFAMV